MTCYSLISEERAAEIKYIAAEWFTEGNPAQMFTDCQSTSRTTIMEFLANQEGLTFFKGGDGKLDSKKTRERLHTEQDGQCYYCERETFLECGTDIKGQMLTIEHLTKVCDGGSNERDNLVGACYRCNTHRDEVPPAVWKIICLDIFELKDNFKRLKKKSRARIKRTAARLGLTPDETSLMFIERDNTIMPLICKKYTDARDAIYAEHWPEGIREPKLEEVA